MSRVYTYSFEDTSVVLSHPNFGSYTAYGTGIGDISITMSNDITQHDIAADLAVVVTKSVKRNGNVNFNVLQSSDFNTWLKKWAAYLEESDASEFALTTLVVSNKSTGETFICTGVSHQKRPDTSFQSQAQNKSWTLMCANISQS